MRNERHDEPLSGDELELFLQYLHRFARHDLDLFDLLEVGDPCAPGLPVDQEGSGARDRFVCLPPAVEGRRL
ncbi:hypothetical protein [Streptomyces sp. NBC_00467]|uniref:hypothetical protein n=1 Tax=Streptomyces sp. NBC_00467 TaxID=2975752 RepID=UPI002E17420D